MAMGNLFDFPLITTLVVIRCSTEIQHFASVDGNWTDLMLSEVNLRFKLRVRICSKENIKIQSNAFIPNFGVEFLILLFIKMPFLPKSPFQIFNLEGLHIFCFPKFCMDISFFGVHRDNHFSQIGYDKFQSSGLCIHFFQA